MFRGLISLVSTSMLDPSSQQGLSRIYHYRNSVAGINSGFGGPNGRWAPAHAAPLFGPLCSRVLP